MNYTVSKNQFQIQKCDGGMANLTFKLFMAGPATSVAPPTKNVTSPVFCANRRLEAPLPAYFSRTFLSLCHNFSHTFDLKMQYLAIDS